MVGRVDNLLSRQTRQRVWLDFQGGMIRPDPLLSGARASDRNKCTDHENDTCLLYILEYARSLHWIGPPLVDRLLRLSRDDDD